MIHGPFQPDLAAAMHTYLSDRFAPHLALTDDLSSILPLSCVLRAADRPADLANHHVLGSSPRQILLQPCCWGRENWPNLLLLESILAA